MALGTASFFRTALVLRTGALAAVWADGLAVAGHGRDEEVDLHQSHFHLPGREEAAKEVTGAAGTTMGLEEDCKWNEWRSWQRSQVCHV